MRFKNFFKYGVAWGISGATLSLILVHCFTVFKEPGSSLLTDSVALLGATLFGVVVGFAGAIYGAVFAVTGEHAAPRPTVVHNKNLVKVVILFALLFFVQRACGITLTDFTDRGAIMDTNSPDYVDEQHVIVQICQPQKVVAFENIYVDLNNTPPAQTLIETRKSNGLRGELEDNHRVVPSSPDQGDKAIVRKWIPSASSQTNGTWYKGLIGEEISDSSHGHTIHALGMGSATFPLIGNTIANQPVYEEEWARPQDVLGLEVTVFLSSSSNPRNTLHYWFKPPKKMPHDQFSAWQEPLSQESDSERWSSKTDTKLMYEKEITVHPVDYATAPVVRYRIMSVRDYYDSNKFWYRERDAISNQYYRNISDEVRDKLGFAPLRPDPIPNCSAVAR